MSSLKQVVLEQVRHRFHESNVPDQTLESLKWDVLKEVIDILRLPVDIPRDGLFLDRARLDDAWNRIIFTCSDYRLTHQEKMIRESVVCGRLDKTIVVKFINILSRKDTVDRVLRSNVLNRLLAVDGFRGVMPFHCKNYVDHLSDRLPERLAVHVEGVRAMYDTTSTTGTAAACRVFFTLTHLYERRVGCRLDDYTRLILEKSRKWVERFMIDDPEEEEAIYRRHVHDDALLDCLAFEKLVEFGNNCKSFFQP